MKDLVGSQAARPHLNDGTTYYPLRLTYVDKIKNLYLVSQAGGIILDLRRLELARRWT